MQHRKKYLLRRNSCENGCLIPLRKRAIRQKLYKSNDARIGKKALVVMVQKINVELTTLWLKKNVPSNSKKLPNLKQMDSHQNKTNNKEVGLSCLIPEKQHFLNGTIKVVNSKLDGSCGFLDKTVLDSHSVICPPEELDMPNPFWNLEIAHDENGSVPVFNLEVPSSLINQSRVVQTNSISDVIDLELTPPSSTTSESIVSDSSSDSEESFHGFLSGFEGHYKEKVAEESLTCQEDHIVYKTLHVAIAPLEPSLLQLQQLYRRKKTAKTRKVNTQTSFRERCLRPIHSLRQFTPFMLDTPLTSQSRDKHGKKGSNMQKVSHASNKNQHTGKKIKKQVTCQTQLFQNTKDQLKLELQQKKQTMQFRNRFDNALDSINKRIFRQSQFWKMLPG